MLQGKVVRLTRAVGLVALAVLAAGCGSGDQARESPATTTSVSASVTPVPGSSTTTPDASASVTTAAGDPHLTTTSATPSPVARTPQVSEAGVVRAGSALLAGHPVAVPVQ